MNIKNITNQILRSGLTQKELADRVGCSQSLIAAYSRGSRGKRPSADFYLKLIEVHKKILKKRCDQVQRIDVLEKTSSIRRSDISNN